jgi:hypothetical protein
MKPISASFSEARTEIVPHAKCLRGEPSSRKGGGLAMGDDAVQRLAGDLADAALAIVSAFSMQFVDLDQRLNEVALVGIPGRIA